MSLPSFNCINLGSTLLQLHREKQCLDILSVLIKASEICSEMGSKQKISNHDLTFPVCFVNAMAARDFTHSCAHCKLYALGSILPFDIAALRQFVFCSASSEIICCELSAIEHLNDKSFACLVPVGVEICHLLQNDKQSLFNHSSCGTPVSRSAYKLRVYVKEMKTIRIT